MIGATSRDLANILISLPFVEKPPKGSSPVNPARNRSPQPSVVAGFFLFRGHETLGR